MQSPREDSWASPSAFALPTCQGSSIMLQRCRDFCKDSAYCGSGGWFQSWGGGLGHPGKGSSCLWRRLTGASSQIFLVTRTFKVTGENQKVETEIRNYTLNEIKTFLKRFHAAGRKEENWLTITGFWNSLRIVTHSCQNAWTDWYLWRP